MEGSLRQAGTKLRLAVQLVDTASGAHLWAQTYDRAFDPEAAFELQDDVVPRIVSTCADRFGVLARSISDAVRDREPGQLGPYEALMRGFGYHQRLTPVEHAEAREALERAVDRAPSNADCWAMLSWIYSHEHAHGFNVRPGSLERALEAARRAVDIAPSNQLAQQALAVVLFFRKETAGCLSAAERAMALNPLDTSNEAIFLVTFTGDWDRGCALIRRAMELNPHHPRWYGTVLGINEYRLANYRAVVDEVVKANAPEVFWTNLLLAAAHAQLGELAAARNALRDLLAQKEDFAQSAGELLGKWFDPQLVGHLIEGLRTAGLEIAPEKRAVESSKPSALISGAVHAEEGFWVAVLPFKYGGANAELSALAEGLTEDIVTGLARFSYLRVIARSSPSRLAHQAVDVRSAGKELGARYVMEGSLRQAGTKLRLAVQLVDATTGAHLWAENYERAFSPEAVFELQDDLVPQIVSTVADVHGVLPRSISEAVRSRTPEQLSPYEAVLRSFGYFERVTAEELAVARSGLESAVRNAPDYADAWAMLALLCVQEHAQGFQLQADSLASGSNAARRAVEAAPSNHLAYFSLAQALFFQKEFQSFRNAAERAVALNPMDGNSIAFLGELLTYAGDRERGLALAGRAKQLNPHHPGWYWYADFYDSYRRGDYRGALGFALKVNLPGQWFSHAAVAAAYGQLGERDAAAKALRDLLRLRPGFAATVSKDIEKWWEPEYVESLIDGWRKAGLDVPALAQADPLAKPDTTVAMAVLPFSDMSPTKDQEYLCEGMAEEIMNALVQVGGIRVASRTSAFRARKDGSDLSAIARALSVGHVLEGSVRTSGTRLRVTAQLTDVASGYQLWSERYDREAADVFAIQDEIAAGVVEAVKARLAPGERRVRARPQVGDLEAYRHYLKGRHLRYTKNDHGGALLCFEQATALDPSHGPSWVGLADVSVLAAAYGLKPSREAYAAAKAALQTAAGLQGESGEALYVEAMIAFGERRWKDSERLLARATQVEPGHVQARCWTGILLCIDGRTEEALGALQQAREIDPLAPYPYAMTGLCLLQARRPEDADRFLDQAFAFDGDNILALWVSGAAQTARGLFDPAIARLERALALSNRGAFLHGTLGWALAAAGRAEDASAVLAALRARPAPATTALPEAWLLAALGDREGAWQVLDRAFDEKQLLVAFTGLPGFDPLRADPRFGALLVRMGLPPARATGALP
jgi:TolB-like protein/Tfp pilus assembly protein PilF